VTIGNGASDTAVKVAIDKFERTEPDIVITYRATINGTQTGVSNTANLTADSLFTFMSSLDHFWHFQEYLDANHDQLTPEECDGEKAVCLSSSNTFAEELAQADHFEVERDILLTQLIGLSEPFMEEMEEAA